MAALPLVMIFSTGQFLTIKSKSLTLTLVILESLDPLMSQLSITSHKARWFLSKKVFFSSIVCGTSSWNKAAKTFQKRFWGWW